MKLSKIILFPLSLIYGLVMIVRNSLYDLGILKSRSFDVPVICVGNLSTGGTGKTPAIEYLVKLLHRKGYRPAVLSRGYGRITKSYMEVKRLHTAKDAGDEPCQLKQKFPGVVVALCSDRVTGIESLCENHPNIDVILLDDGYQHRAVKAGLNVLLTEYTSLFTFQTLLPAGRLREPVYGRKRADILLITKCPNVYSPIEYRRIFETVKPFSHQTMYLSYLSYRDPVKFDPDNPDPDTVPLTSELKVLLFTGIANAIPLKNQVMRHCKELQFIEFSDHHYYTKRDFKKITSALDNMPPVNRMVLTTEKDMQRIRGGSLEEKFMSLPLFYIPVRIGVHKSPEHPAFDEKIIAYVEKNRKEYTVSPEKEQPDSENGDHSRDWAGRAGKQD